MCLLLSGCGFRRSRSRAAIPDAPSPIPSSGMGTANASLQHRIEMVGCNKGRVASAPFCEMGYYFTHVKGKILADCALIRRRRRHLPHEGGRLLLAVRTWQDTCFGVRNRDLQPVGTSHKEIVGNDPCVVPRCLALCKRKFQNTGRSHPSLMRHLPSRGKALFGGS